MLQRLCVLLAAALTTTCGLHVRQSAAPPLDLRCVSPDRVGCGCSLKIERLACEPDGVGVHFASELHQGAPLWINLGGREFALPSRRPVTNSFEYAEGDRWTEEYAAENMSVVIRYRPAPSTCTCPPESDGCEYFDVAADVLIRVAGQPPQKFRTTGACGC